MGPVVTISATGISALPYAAILTNLQNDFQSIYGSDIYIDSDSQDGQWLAIIALALYNTGQAAVAAYNAFSPSTAQGTGLSSNVKINGLQRDNPSNSTAIVSIGGQVGTIITNGIVGDNLGLNTQWALPATVTIPGAGTIDVTAICTVMGDVAAAAGSLTQIITPTRGWQTATNAIDAVEGAPVEDDATLRQRQSVSTSLPAQTPFEAIQAAVANVPNVVRSLGYENDTDTTDGNGLPSHSISMVVSGGDVNAVAQAIAGKKAPGTGTYGTEVVPVTDSQGITKNIKFFELVNVPIYVDVTIHNLPGFVTPTETAIQNAVAQYINSLPIGGKVYYTKLFSPANLSGAAAQLGTGQTQAALDLLSATYDITAITLGTAPSPGGTADITIPFNEAATCLPANVIVTVV